MSCYGKLASLRQFLKIQMHIKHPVKPLWLSLSTEIIDGFWSLYIFLWKSPPCHCQTSNNNNNNNNSDNIYKNSKNNDIFITI